MTNIPALFSGEAIVKEPSILIRESHMKDGALALGNNFYNPVITRCSYCLYYIHAGNDVACAEILPVFVVDFMCAFSVNNEGCSYRDL